MKKLLGYLETLAFVAAAILGAVAEGKITTPVGHWAVIAGGIGAAMHGLIHSPTPLDTP